MARPSGARGRSSIAGRLALAVIAGLVVHLLLFNASKDDSDPPRLLLAHRIRSAMREPFVRRRIRLGLRSGRLPPQNRRSSATPLGARRASGSEPWPPAGRTSWCTEVVIALALTTLTQIHAVLPRLEGGTYAVEVDVEAATLMR